MKIVAALGCLVLLALPSHTEAAPVADSVAQGAIE